MGVSENRGTPKSSILIGVFHYKPSILGYPMFGNTHISLSKHVSFDRFLELFFVTFSTCIGLRVMNSAI